jgi:hypothetical protein
MCLSQVLWQVSITLSLLEGTPTNIVLYTDDKVKADEGTRVSRWKDSRTDLTSAKPNVVKSEIAVIGHYVVAYKYTIHGKLCRLCKMQSASQNKSVTQASRKM